MRKRKKIRTSRQIIAPQSDRSPRIIIIEFKVGTRRINAYNHIYVNENKHPYMSGVVLSDISDHFGTFISISTKKINETKPNQLIIRDMNSFNYEMFLEELENRLQVESLAESDLVKKQFEAIYEIFHETIDKFAPPRKSLSKRKANLL